METQEASVWLRNGVAGLLQEKIYRYTKYATLVTWAVLAGILYSRVSVSLLIIFLVITFFILLGIGSCIWYRLVKRWENSPQWQEKFLLYNIQNYERFLKRYDLLKLQSDKIDTALSKKLNALLQYYEREKDRSLALL